MLVALFLIVLAPAIGSFARLVADRWPDRPVGRSICDHCGTRLALRDLVPLLSWLASRGRSRCCARPLRPALIVAELVFPAATLWALAVVPGPVGWATVGLAWALLTLSMIDLRTFRLPDAGTLGLVMAGLMLAAAGATGPLLFHVAGAMAGYAVLAATAWAYRRWRGIEGLGLGDAKLLAAAGAWCGVAALPTVLLIGCVAGLTHAVMARAPTRQSAIPFGPALALGFWLTWLYGPLSL